MADERQPGTETGDHEATGSMRTGIEGGPRGADSTPPTYGSGPANAGDTMGLPAPAGAAEGAAGEKSAEDQQEPRHPDLQPSGTDATGGASDTTTDYVGGKIRGG